MQRVARLCKTVQEHIKYSGCFSTFLKIRAFCCIADEKHKFTGHLWKSWSKPQELLKMVIIQNLFSSFTVLSFLTSAFPLRRTSKKWAKLQEGSRRSPLQVTVINFLWTTFTVISASSLLWWQYSWWKREVAVLTHSWYSFHSFFKLPVCVVWAIRTCELSNGTLKSCLLVSKQNL